MPIDPVQSDNEGLYLHIYNRGVAGRTIFNNEQDYQVFLSFLQDYLTPANPDETKKEFTINGRIFSGVPHQLNNYLGKIELIAYRLEPDHFHLLLHQLATRSIERFIRSICTRYSKYFNKKYQRTGTLFEGPYRSVQIDDSSHLNLLTQYFHRGSEYSSYSEYLSNRETVWIKPIGGDKNYRDFVEKYLPDQKEQEALKAIILDNASCASSTIPRGKSPTLKPVTKSRPRVLEFATIFVVFLLLLGLGIRNINASSTRTAASSPTPPVITEVLSDSIEVSPSATPEATLELTPTPTESAEPKTVVIITITDGSPSINIRQKPAITSNIIGKAQEGDTFEFISKQSGWFEVKLIDGSDGFISPKYVKIEGGTI
jgi:putative transposase